MTPRAMALLCFALCLAVPAGAQQSAGADSSATSPAPAGPLQRALARADSLSAARADSADSTVAVVQPRGGWLGWLDSWERSVAFGWQSNYDQVTGSAEASAGFGVDKGRVSSNYKRSETDHRQQDRDATQSNLTGAYTTKLGDASAELALSRSTLEDITRIGAAGDVRIANEVNNLRLGLNGNTPLNDDVALRWGIGGKAYADEISNRGNRITKEVYGGAGAARWVYDPSGPATLVALFGYDRVTGDGTLRARSSEAVTTQDTVGAKANLSTSLATLGIDLIRSSYVEDRLDWRRNSSGIVDTTNVPPGVAILGEEREQREKDSINLDGDFQLLPILNLHSSYRRSYEERSFLLSAQGIILDSRDSWQNSLRLDYLEGASLVLDYNYQRNWLDRRTVDDARFRGKEIRESEDVSFTVRQPLFLTTSLELQGQQILEQDVYEDPQNQQDHDRFTERLDATISAEPFANLSVKTSGRLSRLDDINIRSERIGNNKEERLYELRGFYTWKPHRKFTVDQGYRMQIVYRDYHLSNDRDEFNKQGQFNTKLQYGSPATQSSGGVAGMPASPSVEFSHAVNFRQNGRRALAEEPFGRSYTTTQRRFDHVFTGSVGIPISIWTFRVLGERGILDDQVTARGPQSEVDGRLELQLKGVRSFRMGMITISFDAQRVFAYGPRVLPVNRDYWVANSMFTVRF